MLPQRQTTSSWPARRTWPMSPAAPWAPRWIRRPGDDAAADAGADLHVQQVLDVPPVGPVLAERHDVDVVVDQHRRLVVLAEPVRDREAVPAGHDRRRDRLAARERDRARDAHADAANLGRRTGNFIQKLRKALVDAFQDRIGTVRDIHVERRLGQRRAGEIRDDQTRMRRAQVGDQHDARALVERQHRRRTTARGGASARLIHQLVRQQSVEALRNGGASQTGAAYQIGPGDGLPVANQPEQRTRAGHEFRLVRQSAIVRSKAEGAAGLVVRTGRKFRGRSDKPAVFTPIAK